MDTNAVVAVQNDTSSLMEQVQTIGLEWGVKIITFLLVIIIGMWIAKVIKNFVVKLMQKRDVDPTLTSFLASLLHFALKAFVVIAALEKLNVKTASFIAVLGAAGLAIGLALQGSLANFAAGVLMILFKPIKLGDFVEAGGAMGGVEEIGIFTTILKSPDNKKLIVPNSAVMSGVITNFNANGTRRIEIVAGIGYDDDIDKAKKTLEDIIAADDRILKDPAPQIALSEMADSSVNFVVRPWVEAADYWGVYFDTSEAIKKKFDENGISIPYPQRDVHIYEHKDG
ncbi:mechanosensitive ion channel family protein [Pontiella agarivorans]|uniref:Mechanosensitive ion channel n=1 Tax=Pontiella agarivorans TaxID=3038953 RepID=A0ABU5MZ15_9BACT|nr:mechanosensitive ion channel domain-containing protein [Pontiella agarivorans]MDZ8119438.1 mechanosensitive ion channel [Pontiella agarivorans]